MTGNRPQQRRLAHTVAAKHDRDFSRRDFERNASQRLSGAVVDIQAFDLEHPLCLLRSRLAAQINFYDARIGRNGVKAAFGQNGAFVEACYLDAERTNEGHVVLHDDDRMIG